MTSKEFDTKSKSFASSTPADNLSRSRRALVVGLSMLVALPAHAGLTELFGRVTGHEDHGRLAVVLIDTTGSVNGADWSLYERSFQQLLAANRAGDRIVLARIGSDPASRFIALADRSIALTHKRFEDEMTLKRTNATLAEDFAKIRTDTAQPQKSTLILDAITATGQIFRQGRDTQQVLTLLVLSDMLEESPIANFLHSTLQDASTKSLIETRRSQGLLPDLRGVDVYVVGASGKNAAHMVKVQNFWTAVFSASNASLKEYGRNIPTIQR